MMTETQRLEKYVSIVPNRRQLLVQDMKFYAFIHYGINTFTGNEWGSGDESPELFNPKCQNTDQWCECIKSAGMKGVILTCKHHDGFCLWQTETTEHSIKNSPYKNGHGDVVKELSESAKKYGLKFGVYLSPWDRNSKLYGTDAYDDLYVAQLTELLTNYGDIFMLWMDGACGAAADGKPVQKYDFERYWSTALKLQPDICLSDCAPDIRWVGNESGVARESEWNVVPLFNYDEQNFLESFQQQEGVEEFKERCKDVLQRDLGSREFLKNYTEFMWYPAEVDVSIRPGWFYHKSENRRVKSIKKLMNIYYKAVGGNSLLLLNIPPDKDGLIYKKDAEALRKIGELTALEQSLVIDSVPYEPIKTERGYEYELQFEETSVDRMRLEEDTTYSQRVESFDIYSVNDNIESLLYHGTVIGFGRIAIFKKAVTSHLRIVITECRFEPHMKKIEAVRTGAYTGSFLL